MLWMPIANKLHHSAILFMALSACAKVYAAKPSSPAINLRPDAILAFSGRHFSCCPSNHNIFCVVCPLWLHDACREVYGANRYKEVPAKSFFRLAYETAQDPIIILLMVAATVGQWVHHHMMSGDCRKS
jgi:hypothetical protein